MNASAEKNANVITPRSRIAAGTPMASSSVPCGVSHRNEGSRIAAPSTAPPTISARSVAPRAAMRRPAPSAAPTARRSRARVECPTSSAGRGCGALDPAERAEGEAAGDQQQRQEPEEHPAPAGDLADDGRQAGPDDPGHDPRRREHREHPRLEPLREAAPDRRVRRGPDRAAAEALHEPPDDQDQHRRRQAADQQARREQHEPGRERAVERHPVQRAAREHDAHQVAEEERRVDPAVEREVAELVGDDRHAPCRSPATRRRRG